jgi:hypothetical protein
LTLLSPDYNAASKNLLVLGETPTHTSALNDLSETVRRKIADLEGIINGLFNDDDI